MDKAQLNEYFRRLADGDREIFDEIFNTIVPLLQGLFAKAKLLAPDRDDLVQITVTKVFSRINTYDQDRDALPWVMAIAVYELKTYYKKQSRNREHCVTSDGGDEFHTGQSYTSSGIEEALVEQDLMDTLTNLIGELSPIDQETLKLILSQSNDGPLSTTLRKRLQRATERLRLLWRQHHEH